MRRIGTNELHTIDVMRGFVEAQEEYAAAGHDGAERGVYARVLRSDPGKQNGLYWEVADGEPPSPAGPGLAAATAGGKLTPGQPAPSEGASDVSRLRVPHAVLAGAGGGRAASAITSSTAS